MFKKQLISVIGMMILLVYVLVDRFVGEIPDAVAYPMMIVSCALMLAGLAKMGYDMGTSRKQNKEG